jgi:hypothetical protein
MDEDRLAEKVGRHRSGESWKLRLVRASEMMYAIICSRLAIPLTRMEV